MKDGGLKLLQIQDNGTGIRVSDRGVHRASWSGDPPPFLGVFFKLKHAMNLLTEMTLGKDVPSLVSSLTGSLVLSAPIRLDSGLGWL